MSPRQTRIPNEEQTLLDGIIEYCKLKPVRVHHGRAARTAAGYRTAIQGDPGFFDLVIVGLGGVIFAELKRRKGAKWQPGQKEWAQLTAQAQTTGVQVVTWTFDNFPANGGGEIRELIDFIARRPLAHRMAYPDRPTEGQELVSSAAPLPQRRTVAPPTPPVASGAPTRVVVESATVAVPGLAMALEIAEERARRGGRGSRT